MSNKKDKNYKEKSKETNIEDFYDLKTKEMDELVAALKGEVDESEPAPTMNIAEVTGAEEDVKEEEKRQKKHKKSKEFDPYKRGDVLARIPRWIRALFIKYWFFGLVCYFVLMGLGTLFVDDTGYYSDYAALDMYVLCGVITGVMVDCLVNPIFRMMESDKKEFNVYMMFPFPFKQIWTFFANIIYYLVVVFLVGYLYHFFDTVGFGFSGTEPLLFGLFCLIVDMIFIGIKDLIVFLVKKLIKKSREKKISEVENA